jgi:hypothetical protein
MAEKQVPYPYTVTSVRPYLKKGGNHEEYALALYLHNVRSPRRSYIL